MPSESLEDKIKAIMSGNFSPTGTIAVSSPRPTRAPVVTSSQLEPLEHSSALKSSEVVPPTPPLHVEASIGDIGEEPAAITLSDEVHHDSGVKHLPQLVDSVTENSISKGLTSEVDDERVPSVKQMRTLFQLPSKHAATRSPYQEPPKAQLKPPSPPTIPSRVDDVSDNEHTTVDELLFGTDALIEDTIDPKHSTDHGGEDRKCATPAPSRVQGPPIAEENISYTVQLAEKDEVDTMELMHSTSGVMALSAPIISSTAVNEVEAVVALTEPDAGQSHAPTSVSTSRPQSTHHIDPVDTHVSTDTRRQVSVASIASEAAVPAKDSLAAPPLDAPRPTAAPTPSSIKGNKVVRFDDASPPRSAMKEPSIGGTTSSTPKGTVRFSISPPKSSVTVVKADDYPPLTSPNPSEPTAAADPHPPSAAASVDRRRESGIINISPPRSIPKKASKLPVPAETATTTGATADTTGGPSAVRARISRSSVSNPAAVKDTTNQQPGSSSRAITPSKKESISRAATPNKTSDAPVKTGNATMKASDGLIKPSDAPMKASNTPQGSSNARRVEEQTSVPGDSDQSTACHAVRVAVRVRPLTAAETKKGQRRTLSKRGDTLIAVDPQSFDVDPDAVAAACSAADNHQWAEGFEFDHCLWDYSMQTKREVYCDQVALHRAIGLDIVTNAINGISSSCFAYGHTSTGKTYSLFGDAAASSDGDGLIGSESGLIQRVFHDVIRLCSDGSTMPTGSRLFVTFLEIYNEKIRDLLVDPLNRTTGATAPALKLREHPLFGPYVEHLTHAEVFSVDDAFRLIGRGHSARSNTHTQWNAHSSRSHAIVSLEIVSPDDPAIEQMEKKGRSSREAMVQSVLTSASSPSSVAPSRITRVQMIDLAGSEKESLGAEQEASHLYKTGHGGTEKERNELKLIRRSLSSLGFIIKALTKGAPLSTLPYRDSALTFLLRDALSGRNHTTMLATISPAHGCYDETVATLRYAERLRRVNDKRVAQRTVLETSHGARDAVIRQFDRVHGRDGDMSMRQATSRPDSHAATKRSDEASMMIDPLEPHSSADLDRVKDAYRGAASHIVELQIDVDALRADRDSLMVELRGAKTKLDAAEEAKSALSTHNKGLTQSLRAVEKEATETKLLLKRKEETVQRLLRELGEEKQARLGAEQAYHARTKEFLARFEALKNENKALTGSLDGLKDKYHPLTDEKREAATQLDRLRAQLKTLAQSKDALAGQLEAVKGEAAAKDHKLDLLRAKAKRVDELEKSSKAAAAQIERLKADASLAATEKASLAALVSQKEALLKIQGQQSDRSIQLLLHRKERLEGDALSDAADPQTAISRIAGSDDFDSLNQSLLKQLEAYKTDIVVLTAERDALAAVVSKHKQLATGRTPPGVESSAGDEIDDRLRSEEDKLDTQQYTARLQRHLLHDLFLREGEVMYKELEDTQRLTGIIRDLRRQLVDSELRATAGSLDRDAADAVQKQLVETKAALDAERARTRAVEQLLVAAKQELQVAAQSPPPQQLEFARIQSMLQAENSSLKDQLARAHSELSAAQAEALRVKEAMHLEYSALWQSVQDLNRLDEQKDRSIKDILRDRDQAIAEKTRAFETLAASSMENDQLKRELEEIDMFLLNALRTNSYQGKSIVIRNISDSMMTGLARRNNNATDAFVPSSSHGSNRSRARGNDNLISDDDDDGSYGGTFRDGNHPPRGLSKYSGPHQFIPNDSFGLQHDYTDQPNAHSSSPRSPHYSNIQPSTRSSSSGPSTRAMHAAAPPRLPYENSSLTQSPPALSDHASHHRRTASTAPSEERASYPPNRSSRRTGGYDPRGGEVSEEVLQRQIEELSGYLDDETKTRKVSTGFNPLRNSIGSANSNTISLTTASTMKQPTRSNSRPTTPTGRSRFS